MYVIKFIRSDGLPDEEWYWNTYEEACHHMSLFDFSDQDIYKELILSEVEGADEHILKRKIIRMGMYLLNSKPVLECTEDEWDKHSQEIRDIGNRIQEFPDYDCAVIVQYQDEAHRGKRRIGQISLHEVLEILEWGDIKNGADVLLDEDGYLVFVLYGQGYILKDKYHLITVAYQILPFDANRNFMNISKALLNQGNIEISEQQFEEKPEFVS